MRASILAFAAGVVFLQQQAQLPGRALLAALLSGAVGCLWVVWRRWRMPAHRGWRVLLALAVFALGFAYAALRADARLADALPVEWEARDIVLTGVVVALPQRIERGERFEFAVEAVHTPGARVPPRILLAWYHAPDAHDDPESGLGPAVRPGERWRLTVRLKRPHGNANPHGFDYEGWLLERGLRATGSIRPRGDLTRLDAFVWRHDTVVERLRDAVRARFLSVLPEAPYLGVLVALALGDQRAIPAAQWSLFNRTGVTHLVSISGLHVTMIAALFGALGGWLWRRSERAMLRCPAQRVAVMAAWLAALCYALLAGFEVPAQRTLYMLSVVALALLSGRNFGASRTLALALLAVLLLDPWAVLAIGFWLSFGAVAVLLFVASPAIGRSSGWRAGLKRWGIAQWAVTLFSAPMLLFFFQQFSLVSPLANALAIPWVSFVITPLALLFAVLPWPPLLALDHAVLVPLMDCLGWLAQWPTWQRPAPPLWSLPIALIGVAWLLLPRGMPARWLGILLLLPALAFEAERPVAGKAWVDVLDVGQGLAVVIRTARHALLYDTGPRYGAETNAGTRVVLPFLRAVGIDRLDALLVSHRDADHAGGADAVREDMPVGRLLTSIAEWIGGSGEACVAGDDWWWDGVRFSLLHPVASEDRTRGSENHRSCVLRVEAEGRVVLLTGDIESADERALIARAGDRLRSDVLVVPHHGGRGSSSPEFVAAVAAKEAVFSVGYRNSYGHPRADILARHAGSRVWRTDRDGELRFVLSATPEVRAWRQVQARYWRQEKSL
ncbi:DNA internalization-related competence protein ComEC/Rec2 [Propionivibrio dicarboxylicus]|uniref:Competence protein ComEC n=1 Tax=Propionivibrio dicarboxylicus TaxID=83767 RepID=A0A1G7YCP7_9RHOO|nr:DNA internalization-related competence protein ComEC/Rec2 [Propionivibrio dicarboxylicus]SDG94328.1 competence protein ComEC [Propionivibrio dicarboxylicus]